VQLKRRYDLIPNLVEVAKGYLKHEHDTLEAVTAARNLAVQQSRAAFISPGQPTSMAGLASAEASLTGALGRLMAVSEAYPDLKANQNMMSLMEELASTENRIAFARQAFNDAVTEYNNLRETFPNSILAGSFNFAPTSLFEASSTETENVKVSF
jgi:LemA protein